MKPSVNEIKKILITGSHGFVGNFLVNGFPDLDFEIIKIDQSDGIDITSWELIEKIESVDLVVHLAAIVFVPFAYENPRLMYKVNVQGTLNILEYCRLNDVKRFVFTSSYVYGQPKYLPIDEKHPTAPNNPYTRSKLIGEDLCRGYYEDYGLNCIILRPFNIYGPGQNENFVIPSIIKQLREQSKIKLQDPKPRRDFLYISDMVNMYLKTIDYDKAGFEIFNVGSGVSYSVKEILDTLIDISGHDPKIEFSGQSRKNEVMETRADINKAKEILDWKPKVSIDDGLRETYLRSEF
jgi:UDP-glucose 4-epimerase